MAIALALMAAASASAAKPYSFQSVPLGITIDQFRAWPTDAGKVACTGDRKDRPDPEEVQLSDAGLSRLGVVKCVYYYWPADPTEPGSMNGLPLAGGQFAVNDYSYRFVPDPVDKKLRLYEIKLVTHIRWMPLIISTLTKSYGAPKAVSSTVKHNGFGAPVRGKMTVWMNGVSSITVDGPFQTVSDVVVSYRLTRLARIAISAQNAPPPANSL